MSFFGLDLSTWLLVLLGLSVLAYLYLTRNYGIWEKKGVFSLPPSLLFGNNGPVLMGKVHHMDHQTDFYRKLEGKKYVLL